jgi:hypothetical protein
VPITILNHCDCENYKKNLLVKIKKYPFDGNSDLHILFTAPPFPHILSRFLTPWSLPLFLLIQFIRNLHCIQQIAAPLQEAIAEGQNVFEKVFATSFRFD